MAPAEALRPDQIQAGGDRFVSDTGELVWDLKHKQRGVVTINSARSKAVSGYGAGERFDLGGVMVEPGRSLQDGWSAITVTVLEGDGVGPGSRSLITATGYIENTKMGWKNPEKTSVGTAWGEAPSLVEGITARITFPFPADRTRAWALDERGQRLTAIPIISEAGAKSVVAIGPSFRTLWYEVAITAE